VLPQDAEDRESPQRGPGGSLTSGGESLLRSTGFEAFSLVDRATLVELSSSADPAAVERYGLLASAGAIVVALPYDPRPVTAPAPGDALGEAPYLTVGAFAAYNRYATIARLLGVVGKRLAESSSFAARDFRVVVNSRLPEKCLAVMAGLGFVGRSSLVVTRAWGPACLLGALLLPDGYPLDELGLAVYGRTDGERERARNALVPGSGCGSCRACVDACPTGALGDESAAAPGVDTGACIQFWTTEPGEVPERVRNAWGARLYGCDLCAAACPYAAQSWRPGADGRSAAEKADDLTLARERRPGRFVSAALVQGASDGELRALFRKTALGMSWIQPSCLRRNASMSRPS
ncbi:MAG: epoxyqueuosine reductase, partial [Spirochaetales bacterium]|nr:epoxyqueuosine reductase [Spirochaetales bacterium]